MSLLESVSTPIFKYNSLLIGNALRVIAKKKGRPDYPGVVCREVCQAIKNDQPHVLKTEVMGILHHSANMLPTYADHSMGPSPARVVVKGYSDEMEEKLQFVKKWCDDGYGRLTELAQQIGMNTYSLTRRLKKMYFFKPAELQLVYEVVQKNIERDSGGVNPAIGTYHSERFFSALLQIYVNGIVNLAYADMRLSGAQQPEGRLYNVEHEMIIVAGIDKHYKTHMRRSLVDRMSRRGLIVQKADQVKGSCKSFRLADLDFAKTIYTQAFNEVKPHVDAGMKFKGRFSRSVPGRKIAHHLFEVVFDHYQISPDSRAFLI